MPTFERRANMLFLGESKQWIRVNNNNNDIHFDSFQFFSNKIFDNNRSLLTSDSLLLSPRIDNCENRRRLTDLH